MRRMHLRAVMIAIAILAVLLGTGIGLRRRARRFEALALAYGREASNLEDLWTISGSTTERRPNLLMDRAHWNDAVAHKYRIAATRPWLPLDPDPFKITCECGYHIERRVGTAK